MARQAGAAAALLPVIETLRAQGSPPTVFGYGAAAGVFERAGLEVLDDPDPGSAAVAAALLERERACGLLSGTSLEVSDDGAFWQAARDLRIPSVAVLDHWRNYAERFTERTPFDRLPDRICVMDEVARDSLLARGCPPERVIVTGHPHLDSIEPVSRNERDGIRRELGIELDRPVVLFASEPKSRTGKRDGEPGEREALATLGETLIEAAPGALLLVKPHPAEGNVPLPARPEARLVGDLTPRNAVAVSDVVAGMTSIILLEAALAGIPAVSMTPPEIDEFLSIHADLIVDASPAGNLRRLLPSLLEQPRPARRAPSHRGASEGVLQALAGAKVPE
jgi:hypothetical protein